MKGEDVMAWGIFVGFFWIIVAIYKIVSEEIFLWNSANTINERCYDPYHSIKGAGFYKAYDVSWDEEQLRIEIMTRRDKFGKSKSYIISQIQKSISYLGYKYGYPQNTDAAPLVEKYWNLKAEDYRAYLEQFRRNPKKTIDKA